MVQGCLKVFPPTWECLLSGVACRSIGLVDDGGSWEAPWPAKDLMALNTGPSRLVYTPCSASSASWLRYASWSAFALALKIDWRCFRSSGSFLLLALAFCSRTANASGNSHGFRMRVLVPTTSVAASVIAERRESQEILTSSSSIELRASNFFWTAMWYCRWRSASCVSHPTSNGLGNCCFLALYGVMWISAVRRWWSVLAGASALRYTRHDLKKVWSRCLVRMWSISFLVTPSCDIQVWRWMSRHLNHEPRTYNVCKILSPSFSLPLLAK